MSGTTTPPSVQQAVAQSQSVSDLARNLGRDLPTLIRALQAADPTQATELQSKGLAASKTLWGSVAAAVISALAARWGLDLDANSTAILMGLISVGVAAGLRMVTSKPIKGLV